MEKKVGKSNKGLIITLIILIVILILAGSGYFVVRYLITKVPAKAIVNVEVDVQDKEGSEVQDVSNISLEVSGEGFELFERKVDIEERIIKLEVPSGEKRLFIATANIEGLNYQGSEEIDLLPGVERDIKIVVKMTLLAEETTEETAKETVTEEAGSEEDKETTASEDGATKPTVDIDRIYGPVMEGDICVQRFKAKVTGSPKPTIKWNHDDSNGALGKDVAQVNLKAGEEFDLKVTANNSAGSATATRHVKYECTQTTTTTVPPTVSFTADLAVTDIYADSQWKVYIKIKNWGPSNLTNAGATLSYTLGITPPGGIPYAEGSSGPITINLNVGQEAAFDTGISLNQVAWYTVTCSIEAQTFNDPNPSTNNSFTKSITRGP